jgi:hypothetical protein
MENKTLFIIAILGLYLAVTAPLVRFTQADPIISVYHDVPPPDGTQSPLITVHNPTNGSSNPKNLTLAFNVAILPSNSEVSLDGVTRIYYKGDWTLNEVTVAEDCSGSFSVDLTNVPGGNHSVTIYADGIGYNKTGEEYRKENGIIYTYNYFDRFELVGHAMINFYKDLVPPAITVSLPTNITYTSVDVPLDFTVSEEASQIVYSLDGKENITIAGNTTLRGLTNGAHSITLYVADLAGNTAQPETIFFSVNSPDTLFVPLVVTLCAVAIAGSILAFRVYLKRRKLSFSHVQNSNNEYLAVIQKSY